MSSSSRILLFSKLTLLIGLVSIISSNVFAQGEKKLFDKQDSPSYRLRKKKIDQIDILTGFGFSKNSGTFEDFMSPKFVYSLGLGLSHTFTNSFSIQTRVLWELKGSIVKTTAFEVNSDNSGSLYSRTYNSSFKYYTFSLLPTFKIGQKNNIVLGGGGYYSLLKKGLIKVKKIDQATNVESNYEVRDQRNFDVKYDAGVTIFAGYMLPIKEKRSCSLHIMYNKGLVSLFDGLNGYQRNNTVSFLLSYTIKR